MAGTKKRIVVSYDGPLMWGLEEHIDKALASFGCKRVDNRYDELKRRREIAFDCTIEDGD